MPRELPRTKHSRKSSKVRARHRRTRRASGPTPTGSGGTATPAERLLVRRHLPVVRTLGAGDLEPVPGAPLSVARRPQPETVEGGHFGGACSCPRSRMVLAIDERCLMLFFQVRRSCSFLHSLMMDRSGHARGRRCLSRTLCVCHRCRGGRVPHDEAGRSGAGGIPEDPKPQLASRVRRVRVVKRDDGFVVDRIDARTNRSTGRVGRYPLGSSRPAQ